MALLGQLICMKYLAKACKFYVHVQFRGNAHFRVLSVSVSISMSISVSMFVYVSMSVSMLFQFKYGRHGNYIVNSQGSYTRWRGNLKGLS
jgi:hypothetical protein